MVRCETERDYEDLWRELNQVILDEPFVPKKYMTDNIDMDWSITPELQIVIAEKENELEEALGEDDDDDEAELPKKSSMQFDDSNCAMDNGKTPKELIELVPQ